MRNFEFREWVEIISRFKFRAWVDPFNYYIYDIQERVDMFEWFDNPTIRIEQYTGLKDKNDQEIYEGDIVKFTDLELAMNPTGVVCFSDGKFFIKDWEFDDGSYHIVDFYDYNVPQRDFEVIGNIHEDPELLGGKE